MKHISYHIIFISYNIIVKKYIYNREAFKKRVCYDHTQNILNKRFYWNNELYNIKNSYLYTKIYNQKLWKLYKLKSIHNKTTYIYLFNIKTKY